MNYPINYGFIPQTIAQDGDPLDVLVYNHDPLDVGTIAECRVIGILDFTDKGEIDNKILAEPVLEKGDCSVTLEGGHTYTILEDKTLVYEFKTGPYRGQKLDKEFINEN
mgnify:CR=1 FL=1